MRLTTIASGSKGNAYIIECDGSKMLLECGIPFAQIQNALEYDLSTVRGCLLTHEHKDHSKAINDAQRYGIQVFASRGTIGALGCAQGKNIAEENRQIILHNEFAILPFATQHDAEQPLGYLLRYIPTGETLMYATDTYYLRYKPAALDYFLIECNYCKETLDENIAAGRIPQSLRNRIIKSHFELGNVAIFLKALGYAPHHVVICHLSDSNSDQDLMINTLSKALEYKTFISVAEAGSVVNLNRSPF